MTRHLLIWVGKASRRGPEAELCARYLKRINGYASMVEKTLKPVVCDSPRETQRQESKRILAELETRDCVALCDQRGRQLSSPEWAQFLADRAREGVKRVAWVIGGSMGVDEALRRRADYVLSLSRLTLPHALARVLFLEQTYRALCIQAGHPYHHEG